MSYKCSVPACHGNYDEENKVAVFGYPTDEALKEKWLHAIPIKIFASTKNSKSLPENRYQQLERAIRKINKLATS
ncbi:hypothetical protein HNY73_019191 [Argiope bruennichi]|uniref:THAP-type domain-containing protein n=1 Tax=Argiope bruennichi TaxID=94029 RepID=A0A8T0EFW1_ARGBR|nr:hypothetical protein HNY73_019191 [Argiope bruennichi]